MPGSIHLICRRDDGVNLNGLSKLEDGSWRSCCWAISQAEANALVGGWIYLHNAKKDGSEFGGLVRSVEPAERAGNAREVGWAIIFEARAEGRRQAWRGATHSMAWTGGVVDPVYSHELKAI